MVNEGPFAATVRSRILSLLKASEEPLSGERIAATVGVSRVAVWKHIQALERHGYRFESSNRGYLLAEGPEDSLQPWEIGLSQGKVTHFNETDSTMNRALEAALEGAPSLSVFVSEVQSAGRGTSGKAWESPPGGLFFTLLTRPGLEPHRYFRSVIAAQCALVEAVRETSGIEARALWPNDIVIPGPKGFLKAGGILCEHLVSGNGIRFLNLGIGVNTGHAPETPGTASVSSGRKRLLESFLRRQAQWDPENPELEKRWALLAAGLGRPLRWRLRGQEGTLLEGKLLGIDGWGHAVVQPVAGSSCRGAASESDTFANTALPPGSASIIDKGNLP